MNLQKLLEKIFNVDSNTSATIIITFLIFFLGYIITSIFKGIEKYLTRQANRNLYIKNLDTLITSLKKRQNLIKEQLSHLKIEKMAAVPIGKIQFFQIAILNSMGHKTTFESFFMGPENMFRCPANKRLRNKSFVKVCENMANIEFWENNVYEQFTPSQEEINRLTELMGKSLKEIRIYYTELFTKLNTENISLKEKEFITGLHTIVNNWASQDDRTNGFIVNEYSTKPIKLLCDNNSSLLIARELRNLAMDSSHHFGNIEVVITTLNKFLITYDHALRFFSRSTKKIIKILSC